MPGRIEAAATAIRRGNLVVYPTDTVYGLGADALSPPAIRRVFQAKHRSPENPVSLAVPDVATAFEYVHPTDRLRAFMDTFLPGPVTVVCPAKPAVPRELTAGRDRVGVRIPDHELARSLLEHAAPITATSANISGQNDVTHPDRLDAELRAAVTVVLDGGKTPGTPSTVVEPDKGTIHRRGDTAGEIEAWLESV